MIFLVDHAGQIAVTDARFILDNRDVTLMMMIVSSSWCFSMDEACEVARRRRQHRGLPLSLWTPPRDRGPAS